MSNTTRAPLRPGKPKSRGLRLSDEEYAAIGEQAPVANSGTHRGKPSYSDWVRGALEAATAAVQAAADAKLPVWSYVLGAVEMRLRIERGER